MLCYYGDDMEEYRRWEDNIMMNLKEIGDEMIYNHQIVEIIYHFVTYFFKIHLNIVLPSPVFFHIVPIIT